MRHERERVIEVLASMREFLRLHGDFASGLLALEGALQSPPLQKSLVVAGETTSVVESLQDKLKALLAMFGVEPFAQVEATAHRLEKRIVRFRSMWKRPGPAVECLFSPKLRSKVVGDLLATSSELSYHIDWGLYVDQWGGLFDLVKDAIAGIDRVWGVGGVRKVFIADLYDASSYEGTLAEFKKELVAYHAAGDVVLSRADLVQAMPRDAVSRSETRHLNATFHFLEV